ncbi:hypothetical protein WJX84_000445 [Apatococcus fuscideae]|uniref:RRM domain-containing protein n=1 Tax=Apatococcus fuscideae TaxID=2026836 RepID=A0AAW1TAT4_9CHLO
MLVDGRQAEVASGASYESSGASGDPNPQASPSSQSGGVDQRKLVILGLPWSTVEASLLDYFGAFGQLDEAMIMRDRDTGKSRGFGFVTYAHRRMPFAGGSNPNRQTRVFVARIPTTVSDGEFRAYFERFGPVADAYMPKDKDKTSTRGIGFVTFSSPDSVEQVTAVTHTLHGQELAIDKATPKDRGNTYLAAAAARNMPLAFLGGPYGASAASLAAMGAYGSTPPGLGSSSSASGSSPQISRAPPGSPYSGLQGVNANGSSGLLSPQQLASLQQQMGLASQAGDFSLEAAHGDGSGASGSIQALQGLPAYRGSSNGIGIALGSQLLARAQAAQAVMGGQQAGPGSHLLLGAGLDPASQVMLQRLQQQQQQQQQANHRGGTTSSPMQDMSLLGLSGGDMGMMQQMGQANTGGRSMAAEGPAEARAGPRIFIGKLNKDTSESDVRDYFTRFGYVMDVYMPRDKSNRSEHRGFGFVTFETEAAVHRVATHGNHQIKGTVIAIDSAVPRKEDTIPGLGRDEQPPGLLDNSSMEGYSQQPEGLDFSNPDISRPARHSALRQGYKPY